MMAEMHGGRPRLVLHPCVRALIAVALAGSGFIIVSGTTTPARLAAPAVFDLEEMTIADLQARMEAGQETSRSVVEKYLARIEAIDRQGPAIRSVIEVNPDALADADRLDAERKARGARGPLHGIPILIKDNTATGDRMMTSAGSLALAGPPAPRDAFIVARLRAAGAILIGKTNLAEWANFRDKHSTVGWSARGGQTRNPYALDRSPSGSSSGSGAATAANLCAAAIGTETDGSIVSPSSVNSLVGIKPTLGLLSRTGIVPISHSQDTAGPMARTVVDAVVLLGAMAGSDPQDPATQPSDARGLRDYSRFLDADGLKGARIGVVRDHLFGYTATADRLAEAAIADMRQQGAVIIDPANIPTLGRFEESEQDVLLYEFKADLKQYLDWLGPAASVRSLRDVIAFNESHKEQEMPYFGQDLFTASEQRGPLTSRDYKKKHSRYRQMAGVLGIDAVMVKYKLDALVAPTSGPAWPIDLVNGDRGAAGESTPSSVTSVAGYPHITVPMGYARGLPVGISFFGRAWSEPTLIKIAYAYEQSTRHRRPPAFKATADLQ
jgi:amidase